MPVGGGAWVEVDGDLVDGSLDEVDARLDRLACLGFGAVVLGASGIRAIDGPGSHLLGAFVDRVCDAGGTVLIVDPRGSCSGAADRLERATITCSPPQGPWWLR